MTTKTTRHPRRMTRDARHVAVTMGQLIAVGRYLAPRDVVFANRLRVTRLLVVIARSGRDGVERLRHAPPAPRHDHRVLHDVACFKIDINTFLIFTFAIARDALEERDARAFSITHANARQILPGQRLVLRLASLSGGAGDDGSGGTRSKKGRLLLDRTVAVFTRNLDRRARFVVEIAVAVRVLAEVTINAVHAALGVNVVEMHGLAELRGILRRDDVAVRVEQISLAIAFEDFAKQPAMSMKVRELRVAQQRIEPRRAGVFQKIEVGPQATQTRRLRIAIEFFLLFILTRRVLRRWIHFRTVALVIPPRESEVSRDHVRAGVHVTDHALRRWDLARELVLDRMARLVFHDRRVGSLREAEISGCVVESGVRRISIVRVDHVTRRATGRSVIARVIISAEKVQGWIEQTCFL